MVLFLLLMLVAVVLSGWLLTWDMFWGEGWLEDLHELLATIVMGRCWCMSVRCSSWGR